MEPLLFLAHRLPYPPNKGDKIRSYHFLKHLAQRYRVYLGTFIDDPSDWAHCEALKAMCAEVHVEGIVPWAQRARSVTGLLQGEALTLPYFRNSRLQRWVDATVRRQNINRAFVFSSPMAQYVEQLPQLQPVIDLVDMDSAKWIAYAGTVRWPASAIYGREGRRLLAYERTVAARAAVVTLVTEEEAQILRREVPEYAGRIVAVGNGVDSDYFAPSRAFASPYPPDVSAVVFTGAMDYWPNIDAVIWFARAVLPAVRLQHPQVRFYVAGMNPDSRVRSLGGDEAIVVTGRVDDIRPYLQHAKVVVAPLRVARGLQNKVLEAMAMAKAIVVTTAAATGLEVVAGEHLEVADGASDFSAKVTALMNPARADPLGAQARARILLRYTWAASAARLDAALAQAAPAQAAPAPQASSPVTPAALHYALPGK